ncbi:MAG: uroporphyrinogen-III synthase [Gammaproteobacteria bacterium]|nr:uroporphyrinogen-III synthase [Gammaproteobacteria bacterium]
MKPLASITTSTDRPLAGLSVLVTRPQQQADYLIQNLQQLGADTLHQPCINIQPYFDPAQQTVLSSINHYDFIIFVSANAVDYGFELLRRQQLSISKPLLAAIGKATVQRLQHYSAKSVISPEHGFDSEALLNCGQFLEHQIRAKKILIIRGGAGREHLKDVLKQRQASVDYLDVYQRSASAIIITSTDLQQLDILTVSSQQGLENLLAMLDSSDRAALLNKTLITPGSRCSDRARELGFKRIETADNATDDAMLSTIIRLAEQHQPNKRDVKQ